MRKVFLALIDQLLPCRSVQTMLERRYAFMVCEVKQISENAVVSDTKLTSIIPIRDVNDLYPISEYGKAVCLEKAKFDQFIRPAIDA